jgi:hypothetical protein
MKSSLWVPILCLGTLLCVTSGAMGQLNFYPNEVSSGDLGLAPQRSAGYVEA